MRKTYLLIWSYIHSLYMIIFIIFSHCSMWRSWATDPVSSRPDFNWNINRFPGIVIKGLNCPCVDTDLVGEVNLGKWFTSVVVVFVVEVQQEVGGEPASRVRSPRHLHSALLQHRRLQAGRPAEYDCPEDIASLTSDVYTGEVVQALKIKMNIKKGFGVMGNLL